MPSFLVDRRYCTGRCARFQCLCVAFFGARASAVVAYAMSGLVLSAIYRIYPIALPYVSAMSLRIVSLSVGGSMFIPLRYGELFGLQSFCNISATTLSMCRGWERWIPSCPYLIGQLRYLVGLPSRLTLYFFLSAWYSSSMSLGLDAIGRKSSMLMPIVA